MERTLVPEILDTLSPDDPAAVHNRRDLRIVNRFLGTRRWFASHLQPRFRPGDRILEIGSGTGELGRWLWSQGYQVDGLDLWPRPADWPAHGRWHQADLRSFDGYADYPIIIASLILHQFPDAELTALGARIARARSVLALEPGRSRFFQRIFGAGCTLLGGNHVTRHDGHVSIGAGFRDRELPDCLNFSSKSWSLWYRAQGWGAYRMIADRLPPECTSRP